MADPTTERYDLAALRDPRAIVMYPVIAFGLAIPFLAHWFEPIWSQGSLIAQGRFLARTAITFLFLACYPAMLITIRIGIADVDSSQHRRLLTTYPTMTTLYQSVAALDGCLLVASPRLFSLPNFWFDLGVSLAAVALIPVIIRQQAFFVGFDANRLKKARVLFDEAPELAHARAPLDTLDYRVLQLIARSSSDMTNVMINDMGIGHRDLMLRMSKLVALGYLHLVFELHGSQVVLTTLGTDTLALPVSLFTWNTDDCELLAELATARMSLENREPQKVVVACARVCERLLRNALYTVTPKVTHIGTKELSKATLGDLIGAARANKLIGRFEDSILSAINERRKKIHALEGTRPIDDQDAFVLYTLTEIAARDMLNPQERAASVMSVVPQSAAPA